MQFTVKILTLVSTLMFCRIVYYVLYIAFRYSKGVIRSFGSTVRFYLPAMHDTQGSTFGCVGGKKKVRDVRNTEVPSVPMFTGI